MKIIEDILATLDGAASVLDIRQGPFQTAVLTRRGGLASTPHEGEHHHGKAVVLEAGNLLSMEAMALARLALSPRPFEAAVGMATVNSLIEVDEGRCTELNAADLLIERGTGKKVAIVGHFPFVPRLRAAAGELWVIELNPQEGDREADEAVELIPQADVVGITGTALINHTIADLLGLCRRDAFVVMLGGTAPLSPVLFDYGIDAVSGTLVVDAEAALLGVSQGATFRQLKGLRLLTMAKERN
jgi:uncharacterized protein (DUF4213/DUF364 family)